MVDLHETDAGRMVRVGVGKEVRVTLRQSGGTGYRWRVSGCEGILKVGEERTEASGAVPGAGMGKVWVFGGVGVGGCVLRFVLGRSWEKTGTGKVVSFPVTVVGD